MTTVIDRYKKFSIFIPSGFFILTNSVVSSRSYGNFLMFYSYVQALKHKFSRFWLDQVYYVDPSVVIPFIKGDENVYKGHPVVPENYLEGALQGIGINIILFVIGFFCFIRVQYKITKEDISRCQDFFVEVDDGDLSLGKVRCF
ncbi:MAG: hypothetical protein GY950_16275 [bacterium]|nr:hypothetical protein [bacterium]